MLLKGITYPVDEKTAESKKILLSLPMILITFTAGLVSCCSTTFTTQIASDVGAMEYLALIMLVYNLFNSLTAPVGGKIGDLYGRKRALMVGLIVSIVAVLLCVFATSPIMFIVGWSLVGLATGLVQPCMNGLFGDIYTNADRVRFNGLANGFNAAAVFVGNVLGGKLMDLIGSQNVMLVYMVLYVITWIALFLITPDIRVIGKNIKIDWIGIILMFLAIGPLTFAFATGGKQLSWSSPLIYILMACSVVCMFAFYKYEQKPVQPLIDFSVFKIKYFIPTLLILFCKAAQQPVQSYSNTFVKVVMNYSAAQQGLLQLLVLVPVFLSPIVGRWLAKTQKFRTCYTIAVTLLLVNVFAYYFLLTPDCPFVVLMIIRGIGNLCTCFSTAPVMALVMVLTADRVRGVGQGICVCLLYMFNTIMVAIGGLIYNAFGGDILVAYKYICYPTILIGAVLVFVLIFGFKNFRVEMDN